MKDLIRYQQYGWIFTPLIVAAYRFKTLEEAKEAILTLPQYYLRSKMEIVPVPTYLEG